MRRILPLILMVFGGFGVFAQTKKPPKKATAEKPVVAQKTKESPVVSTVTDEEYAVYMTILGKDINNFVVSDATAVDFVDTDEQLFKKAFKQLKPETVQDFYLKNKESVSLERKFPTKNSYTLMSKAELKEFFDKSLNWQGFYKKYPDSGGFSTFSRVGFGKDAMQALVFVAHSCGGLCGTGYYYFLQKENGEWKIVGKQMTWIS